MFLSDNGCCAEGGMFGYEWRQNGRQNFSQWRKQSGRSSSTGEAWSNASNTPFRLHKRWVHEGGIATPLIVHWPNVVTDGGKLTSQPGHVIDIMSTCLDVAGGKYPTKFAGEDIKPTPGKSLLANIRDRSVHSERTLFWEHETHAAIRKGDWKLVTENGSDAKAWELYDFSNVRTETVDLAAADPDRVEQMKSQWTAWATQANVLPWPKDRKKQQRPQNR
jgi:arylsulfatase